MLCEHCGVEIPEGKLYCPGCGQPLQIVPDFDPGFDDQIELSESDIEGAINGDPEVINPDALLKARTKELEHSEEIAIFGSCGSNKQNIKLAPFVHRIVEDSPYILKGGI